MPTERQRALDEALRQFERSSAERRRGRLFARTEKGEVDITEDVVSMMDRITDTLDWGSGFFSDEDLVAYFRVAELLKMDIPASVERPTALPPPSGRIHYGPGRL